MYLKVVGMKYLLLCVYQLDAFSHLPLELFRTKQVQSLSKFDSYFFHLLQLFLLMYSLFKLVCSKKFCLGAI